MGFVIPAAWSASATYTSGATVALNGVVYEALQGVGPTADDPSRDAAGTTWRVVSVLGIQDYNSLVEAVRLQLNNRTIEEINDSIPLFIQLTEESLKMRLRAPFQRRTEILTVDAQSRVTVPSGFLELINMRFNAGESTKPYPFNRDIFEIQNANKEEFLMARNYNNAAFFSHNTQLSFDSSVYWFDSQYFHLAPEYEMGEEIEIDYYQREPRLGETIGVVNAAGDAVNSAGQTLAEWEAAGNPANTFVQATQINVVNGWISLAPNMLLYGACLRAKPFLKDLDVLEVWSAMYKQSEDEVMELISTFEDRQPHLLLLDSPYNT